MAKEQGSIESRAKEGNSGLSSPVQEVLNSALSLAAVVGLTLVGSVVLSRLVGRRSA